uniref:ER membrane protein complex subunit 1 n=1 Tax=Ascaris suum TaxID=6253 RepID=F1KV51_ASCSU
MGLLYWFTSAFFVITVFITADAIFEDQVGKFDWRQQHIGCPYQIHFDRSKSVKSDFIFVSTEANVLAALRSNTGSIAWRQLMEENSTSPPLFILRNKMLISLARNGEVVRAWEREGGSLAWETQIHFAPTRPISMVASSEGVVFVLDGSSLIALSVSNGQVKWSANIDKTRDWVGAVQGSQLVTVIGGVRDHNVEILRYDSQNGMPQKKQVIDATWFNKQRCKLSNTILLCDDASSLFVVDVSSDPAAVQKISLDGLTEVIPLKVDGFVAARSHGNVFIYRVAPSQLPQLLVTLEKADAISAIRTPDGRNLISSFSSMHELSVYDLSSGKRIFESKLSERGSAPISQFTFAVSAREFEFVTVGEDCRIDFFVGCTSTPELLLEWSRHEALSAISTVRMVDLPLSEAQAGIESEFIAEANILESLIRRLSSQADQFHRAFIKAANQILSASSILNIRSRSFTDWMSSLRSSATHHDVHKGDAPIERDYFNLRKIIVVSTLKSTVFGLDSSDGSIIWRLYLGRDTIPLKESLGSLSVPLFIQRTTTHYQYSALAAVALANKYTRNGLLITFDPISGKMIERIDLSSRIKRVELLPLVDAYSVHPLLIIDKSNKISTYPKLSSEVSFPTPIHLFSFEANGHLEGFRFDVQRMELQRTWGADLRLTPQQKIIAIASKPAHQRVHSPGKVLGDRSVLYKYSNPNLVVIAVLDSSHSVLHIDFIDAVNGYVVYKAKQAKVAGPVHLVQCENWLTYSYWNEKNRRMEIAVIELYEGSEQTDELRFNSLTPTLPPVVHAISRAYIFPQGISALGVTETEQGLSTRSLLVAMPFGGIYGISKRIIDARRPLEMTPELAEEMLIPYRPELPIAPEDFVNYNQTVYNIRSIKASPSGLESTSLMLAYGLDLFFARLTPSGTFDILKDDFDHLLISIVLVGLVVACLICKKLGRNHSLKQAWQ